MISWLPAVEYVLENKSYVGVSCKTNGVVSENNKEAIILDMTTANMLNTVFNALGSDSQDKFINMPIVQAVSVGWKLVK